MSLKRLYCEKDVKICLTCKFIDEYALNVETEGEVPHGYDGTAFCQLHNFDEEETNNNRDYISPLWKACDRYEKCSYDQMMYNTVYDRITGTEIPNENFVKDEYK